MNAGHIEKNFREVESKLDSLLAKVLPTFEQNLIGWKDESVRSSFYKEPYLSWSFGFERKWEQDLVVNLVRVWVTCGQQVNAEDPFNVTLIRRVERFRTSQESSVDERTEQTYLFSQIEAEGLGDVVLQHFQTGAAALGIRSNLQMN